MLKTKLPVSEKIVLPEISNNLFENMKENQENKKNTITKTV